MDLYMKQYEDTRGLFECPDNNADKVILSYDQSADKEISSVKKKYINAVNFLPYFNLVLISLIRNALEETYS